MENHEDYLGTTLHVQPEGAMSLSLGQLAGLPRLNPRELDRVLWWQYERPTDWHYYFQAKGFSPREDD